MNKRYIILMFFLLLVMVSFQIPTASVSAASANYAKEAYSYSGKIIKSENKWLCGTQLDNGAFPEYKVKEGTVVCEPYYASFVCLALLDGNDKYPSNAGRVKDYMDWYFSHMNTASEDVNGLDGTVYDYNETVSGYTHVEKEEVDTVDGGLATYDSTDSYAAEFLSVLWKYYSVTKDSAYIEQHKSEIGRIADVILSTMDDGLTYATPSYKMKYLMDNCEVYGGLRDAAKLYSAALPGETAKLSAVISARDLVKVSVNNKMWTSKSKGHYWYAIDEEGTAETFRWTKFYPDATSQLFPITNGVISCKSSRAKHSYKYFNKYWSKGTAHHTWEKLRTTDENCWGDMLCASVMMRDTKRSAIYMKTYYKKYSKKHQYPLYNADSAKILRAAYQMRASLKGAVK